MMAQANGCVQIFGRCSSQPGQSDTIHRPFLPLQIGRGQDEQFSSMCQRPFDNFDRYMLLYRQQLEAKWTNCYPSHFATGLTSYCVQYPCCTPAQPVNTFLLRSSHQPADVFASTHIHRPWENTEEKRGTHSSLPCRPTVIQRSTMKMEGKPSFLNSESDDSLTSRSSIESPIMKDHHAEEENYATCESDSEIIVVDDINSCRYCNKVLPSTGGQHEKRCKVKKEGKYRCPECSKTYSQSHTLKQHMHSHTGQKPYRCTFCPKSFADISTRNKHERIHTGETPYVCPECNRGFTQSGNMYRHMDKIHGENFTSLYRQKKNLRRDTEKMRL